VAGQKQPHVQPSSPVCIDARTTMGNCSVKLFLRRMVDGPSSATLSLPSTFFARASTAVA
jgi:hypothetical protein